MKLLLPILFLLLVSSSAAGKVTSSAVYVVTVYSQNEQFYLRSIPYDNEMPSLRGTTSVFRTGTTTPLYTLDRGFDAQEQTNSLILSNDGEVIFYSIRAWANEEKDGLKSINVYKRGQLIRSFTESDITGCDNSKERCSLTYSNYDEVIDVEKSRAGSNGYQRVFKENVADKERFLFDFPVFSIDNIVYLTDSNRKTHTFDLTDGKQIETNSFDSVFDRIKNSGSFNKFEAVRYEAPVFLDFPTLKNGRNTHRELAGHIDMKVVDSGNKEDERYKAYRFEISGYIYQDGSVEIEAIDADSKLPKEKILEFFRVNRFSASLVPGVFEKWYFDNEYFYFRNKNDQVALREKQEEIAERRQEYQRRLTLETINGIYIPANLGECFVEMDKQLSEIDRKEMQSLPGRKDMITYHLSLGMWMRNNWGLWAGSRLQKYFGDKGISHPEDMSSIILTYYHDWLNGKKDTWKDWENKPTKPYPQ